MSNIEDEGLHLASLERSLAARLRMEREARGWSLSDLAQRFGVSRAMISKVERAEASPTAALLGRLSGAFGLTLSTLLARAEGDPCGSGRLVRADRRRIASSSTTAAHRAPIWWPSRAFDDESPASAKQPFGYRTTISARATSASGRLTPMAAAAAGLTASSSVCACSTGMSAGFSPRSTRATIRPVCRPTSR